ncbi:MAG: family oxidoreductase [Frankiales bacterium]|nr:family oxidoreductase [Frankiales bacterium]
MTRSTTDLTGRVAVLTGAAGGLGAVTARVLAEAGATVVLADVSADRLQVVADRLHADGFAVRPHVVDLVDERQVVELVAATVREHGRLDVLVNMAAATHLALQDPALGELSAELWDATLAVNARGPMLLTRHALPHLLASDSGSVVNISSGLSLAGEVAQTAYSASKAALNSLTRDTAAQYGDRGLRCNAIAVGMVATEVNTMSSAVKDLVASHTLLGRLGRAEEVAQVVLFLASDQSSYVTGQVLCVDGGILAALPTVRDLKALLRG